MSGTLGLFTIPHEIEINDYVTGVIGEYANACTKLIVAVSGRHTELSFGSNVEVVKHKVVNSTHPALLRLAVGKVPLAELKTFESVLLGSAGVFGPFGGLARFLDLDIYREADVIAPLIYLPQLEHRKDDHQELLARLPERVYSTSFMRLRIVDEEKLWSEFRDCILSNDNADLENHICSSLDIRVTAFIEHSRLSVAQTGTDHAFKTTTPWLYEAQASIAVGIPFFSSDMIHLPYTAHDLSALDLRNVMVTVKDYFPSDYDKVWQYILSISRLRDIHGIADEVEIFDEIARNPDKTEWEFGPIAVFIHAFYAEMMDEFWTLLEKIDVPKRIFITTATRKNLQRIEVFLGKKGLDVDDVDVRVVAQNRGRDMSALFITFRDVIASGEYDVCLRLHSKRTPQVAPQVGQSFKNHLFDNLVYTTGYVRNVLDYLEANKNVGLAMPPTIHIGFGTMGHAWFTNRPGVEECCEKLGLDVKLDSTTPLAPYGTMYWFRANALRKMFEYEWRWDSYNEEPMHVDGGVAHIQERLIGYVAQDAGYRVVSIANRYAAARNYAKLEYKLQMLASGIPHANIWEQQRYMMGGIARIKASISGILVTLYQRYIMTNPTLLKLVRPIAKSAKKILK